MTEDHPANATDSPPDLAADDIEAPQVDADFVHAELVPDAPGPLSFGMKAMFALMAISGVQFALMSYLGPLVGLLAGIGLCAVATVVLMISAVVLRAKPGQQLMDQLDRIAIRLVIGMVILFFGTILAGGGQIILMALEDVRFAWRMQDELGFTYKQKTLTHSDSQKFVDVLELTNVKNGSAFDRAGLQSGDLILLDGTADSFLKKLDELRGQSIDIAVGNYAPSTANTQVDEATERSITVELPK